MQKIIINKVIPSILTLILMLNINLISLKAEENSLTYAQVFYEIMEQIDQNYVGNTSRQKLFEGAMKGMFDSLDNYSEFFDPEQTKKFKQSINKDFQGIGVQFQKKNDNFIVIKLIPGGSAEEMGILAGDILLNVNGEPLEGLTTDEVVSKISGEKGTQVEIDIKRGNQILKFLLQRRELHFPTVEQIKLSDLGIDLPHTVKAEQLLCVNLSSFGETTAEDLQKIISNPANAKSKVLILDLRNNGGGYVESVVTIGNMLLPAGKIVTFKDKNGEKEEFYSKQTNPPYRKVIALINKNTASAAEILAAALQDSGIGILIGENTYGKGVAQAIMDLGNGAYSYKLTIQEFFRPSGKPVQKVGVAPNIPISTPDYIVSDHRLFVGDESEAVYNTEKILNYLGYYKNKPDHKLAVDTIPAIYAFQKSSGLSQSSVVDFTTQKALNNALYNAYEKNDVVLNKAIEESVKILLTDVK